MRYRAWAASGLALTAACSLLTNLDDLRGTSSDGGPTCDAPSTPCLVGLDSQWQPVSVTLGGCAPGWASLALRTNPRARDGGCACGTCTVSGIDCSAAGSITSGNACSNIASAALPGKCTAVSGQHIEADPPKPVSNCFAPNDAGPGGDSDELTLCLPGCNSDFCGAAERCVLADGDVACPSGFTLYTHAGTSVDQACSACTCTMVTASTCQGNVTAFASSNCDDAGAVETFALGTCNVFTLAAGYQSALLDVSPSPGACTTTMPPSDGGATLGGLKTICCN